MDVGNDLVEGISDPEEVQLDGKEKDLLSVFDKQNVILKVGNIRLRVNKEQLMVQSVVFERMFNSSFKEANATEIELPGKDPITFGRFIRIMLPGFSDAVDDSTVHDILPLATEYQVTSLLKQIDEYLANKVKSPWITIVADEIIKNILEAEQYHLENYLNACIDVASRTIHRRLTNNIQFSEITQDTRLKICLRRLSQIETIYDKNRKVVTITSETPQTLQTHQRFASNSNTTCNRSAVIIEADDLEKVMKND